MKKVAIIEDDMDQARLLALWLKPFGFESTLYINAELYLEATTTSSRFDLILVDWFLPGMNGLSLIEAISSTHKHTPIILVTRISDTNDLASALDAGADDFINKPIKRTILIAKINAIFRRYNIISSKTEMEISINRDKRLLIFNDQKIRISKNELKILELFSLTSDSDCITREELTDLLWPNKKNKDNSRALDLTISRIRKKLNSFNPVPGKLINQYGKGYTFKKPEFR